MKLFSENASASRTPMSLYSWLSAAWPLMPCSHTVGLDTATAQSGPHRLDTPLRCIRSSSLPLQAPVVASGSVKFPSKGKNRETDQPAKRSEDNKYRRRHSTSATNRDVFERRTTLGLERNVDRPLRSVATKATGTQTRYRVSKSRQTPRLFMSAHHPTPPPDGEEGLPQLALGRDVENDRFVDLAQPDRPLLSHGHDLVPPRRVPVEVHQWFPLQHLCLPLRDKASRSLTSCFKP